MAKTLNKAATAKPAKGSGKPKGGGGGMLSADPTDADKTGFLHGVRALMKKVRAILFSYPDKDGNPRLNDDGSKVEAPGLQVTFETQTGEKASYDQFYANGQKEHRVPTKDGHGFTAAKGSTAKGALVEGSNAFSLISSLVGSGYPQDKLKSGDYTQLEGLVVDLIAQPVQQNRSRAAAEGAKVRTIAVVSNIVSGLDDEKAEDSDDDEDTDDADETDEDEAESEDADDADDDSEDSDDDDSDSDDDDDADGDDDEGDADAGDPIADAAREAVAEVLQSKKYNGKKVKIDLLAREVLSVVRESKDRRKIVALVQDPDFHEDEASPWKWDKKLQSAFV